MSSTLTAMLQPIPYLHFSGTCEEAVHYYEKVFGAKLRSITRAGEAPACGQLPAEFADKILNAQLEMPGGALLYAGDCPPHIPYQGMHGFGLTLNFDRVEEAEAIYHLLAEEGEVVMPFGPTFWAEKFGMVTDKYGVSWMLNGVLQH